MQSAIEYAAIPTINLTPLFLVTNPPTNSSQSETLQIKPLHARTRENFCAISLQKQALIDDILQIKLETFFHLGYHPLYNHHLALLFYSYSLSNLQHS